MNLLLDTHSLLWSLFEQVRLSNAARESIMDRENEVYASVISFWEISLKYSIGKLSLKNILPDELPRYAEKAGFEILGVTPDEVSSFYRMPARGHKDPFDRLLLWQCIRNNMTMITRDRELAEYRNTGLKSIW